ncbi:4Fe-4S dicluster domain-containing protein [Lachnospiraceae bacterium G41]|nr:4Fe-4S dicluster domain-containing protein [Lachnospiraceae bacterium G41]
MSSFFSTLNEADCCGCLGCVSVCPNSAIGVITNRKGFLYPQIDETKCIHCGACVRFCQFSNTILPPKDKVESYVCVLNNKYELNSSSSGGVFFAVSDYVLKNGGVVYGAVMDDDFYVRITRADNVNERNQMRRTKYVQGIMGDSYDKIKKDILEGKIVLFSGTPCQCLAVKQYLGESDNLILLDFICHGVPSPQVFIDYLEYVEKITKSKVKNFYFRSKEFGHVHSQHSEALCENGATYYMMPSADIYYKSFLANLMSRESCYNCPFASTERITDITMGDAWGSVAKELNSLNGISTLIVNSEKGRNIINQIMDSMEFKQVEIMDRLQPQLKYPAKKPIDSNIWWQKYISKGLKGTKKISFSPKERMINFSMESMIRICNYIHKPEIYKKFLLKFWK